jgi:hypothetical protein
MTYRLSIGATTGRQPEFQKRSFGGVCWTEDEPIADRSRRSGVTISNRHQ